MGRLLPNQQQPLRRGCMTMWPRFLHLVIVLSMAGICRPAFSQTSQPFISTWTTTNSGSSDNNSVILPISGDDVYSIYWEQTNDPSNNGMLSDLSGADTLTFPNSGTFRIAITADALTFAMNGGGDRNKLVSIEQWGSITWNTMAHAFEGCANLINNATDAPDLTLASDLSYMFSFASGFNGNLTNWDVSQVTDLSGTFYQATAFNQTLENWNIESVQFMSAFLSGSGMSRANYESSLAGWASLQNLQSGLSVGVDGLTYCDGASDRQILVNTYNWTFSGDEAVCFPFHFMVKEQTAGSLLLSWEDPSDSNVAFSILVGEAEDGPWDKVSSLTDTSYTYPIGVDTSAYFAITAIYPTGEEDTSAIVYGSTFQFPGQAIRLDGTDDYFEIPDLHTPSGSFTLEAWIKADEIISGWATILEFSNDDPYLGLFIGSPQFYNAEITMDAIVDTSRWYHIAAIYDTTSATSQLYVDGRLIGTSNNSLFNLSQNEDGAGIGYHSGDSFFKGIIDEVRVWNYARTPEEIQTYANKRLNSNTAGLTAYYKMDNQDSLMTLWDQSSDDYTATWSGKGGTYTSPHWIPSHAGFTAAAPVTVSSITVPDGRLETASTDNLVCQFQVDISASDEGAYLQSCYLYPQGAYDTTSFSRFTVWESMGTDDFSTATFLTEATFSDYSITYPNGKIKFTDLARLYPGDTTVYLYIAADMTKEVTSGTFYMGAPKSGQFNFFNSEVTAGELSEGGFFQLVSISPISLDSLALLTIYDSLGGNGWTRSSNWKSGLPLSAWTDVLLSDGRVVRLDLADNNLIGNFPKITAGLEMLDSLMLNQNSISRLPDLNILEALSFLDVSGNALLFDDLEQFIEVPNFNYSPQAIFGDADSLTLSDGTFHSLSFSVGGSSNTYQWVQVTDEDSVALENATSSELTVGPASYETMGAYHLVVSNRLLPDLTLVSAPLWVATSGDLYGTAFNANNEPLTTAEAAVLQITKEGPYDTLRIVTTANGTFLFEELTLGNYLIAVEGDSSLYLPTYYQTADSWSDADVFAFRQDSSIAVTMILLPDELDVLPDGEGGLIQGVVESELGDSENSRVFREAVKRAGCSIRRAVSSGRGEAIYELVAYEQTDENGQFKFDNLEPGEYWFGIDYPGIPMDSTSDLVLQITSEGLAYNTYTLEALITSAGISVTIARALGIIDQSTEKWSIYPVPTSDYVHVVSPEALSADAELRLMNLSGETIYTQVMKKGGLPDLKLSVGSVPSGVYLLTIVSDKKTLVSSKIIVDK